MDKILDDLDEEKKDTIDIFGFVKDMRTRRVNMVQTSVSVERKEGRFTVKVGFNLLEGGCHSFQARQPDSPFT